MASLNIPFLVLSRSNFEFESNDSCYSGIVNQSDAVEGSYVPPREEDCILAISDT